MGGTWNSNLDVESWRWSWYVGRGEGLVMTFLSLRKGQACSGSMVAQWERRRLWSQMAPHYLYGLDRSVHFSEPQMKMIMFVLQYACVD